MQVSSVRTAAARSTAQRTYPQLAVRNVQFLAAAALFIEWWGREGLRSS